MKACVVAAGAKPAVYRGASSLFGARSFSLAIIAELYSFPTDVLPQPVPNDSSWLLLEPSIGVSALGLKAAARREHRLAATGHWGK